MGAVQASVGLRALLPPAVTAYQVTLPPPDPWPAVRRDAEFRAGRAAAAAALAELGADPQVGRHPDRRPSWPPAVVGSIAHCSHLAVAAAAPRSAFQALGVDVEDLADVGDELTEVVLTPGERAALPGADEPALVGVVFSIKESAYKCWSPLLGLALDWTDIEVEVEPASGVFTAVVVGPSARLSPPPVTGRYAVRDAHVVSAGWVVQG